MATQPQPLTGQVAEIADGIERLRAVCPATQHPPAGDVVAAWQALWEAVMAWVDAEARVGGWHCLAEVAELVEDWERDARCELLRSWAAMEGALCHATDDDFSSLLRRISHMLLSWHDDPESRRRFHDFADAMGNLAPAAKLPPEQLCEFTPEKLYCVAMGDASLTPAQGLTRSFTKKET